MHEHDFNPQSFPLLALHGVTTALELEVGVTDFARFQHTLEGKALINYGASASFLVARMKAWELPVPPSRFGDPAAVIPKSGARGARRIA